MSLFITQIPMMCTNACQEPVNEYIGMYRNMLTLSRSSFIWEVFNSSTLIASDSLCNTSASLNVKKRNKYAEQKKNLTSTS